MSERQANTIREHLLAEIHLGHLRPGDRLPSIRELERRTGMDQRRLARIYREMEDEGLLEIRGRSGVYLSAPGGEEPRLGELGRWATAVAVQGWLRRVGVQDLPALFHELTQTIPVRCLFVESSRDQIEQFGDELRADFGFEVSTFDLNSVTDGSSKARAREITRLAHSVDVVATTVFHASAAAEAAAQAGKECVVITLNDAASHRLASLLAEGPIVLVADDPNHRERVGVLQARLAAAITVVTREQLRNSRQPSLERVFVTRSAKRADPSLRFPLLFPYELPVICNAAAHELCRTIINYNMTAGLRAKESVLKAAGHSG